MDMYENRDEGRFPDIRLVDFCNRFCLSNRINEPTRVTKTSKSLIDVLLTSHAECCPKCKEPLVAYHNSRCTSNNCERSRLNLYSPKKKKNSRPKPPFDLV